VAQHRAQLLPMTLRERVFQQLLQGVEALNSAAEANCCRDDLTNESKHVKTLLPD